MNNNTTSPNELNSLTDGIILADKPTGFTSFDLTRVISKAIHIKKVGHSGTLDKAASGLMIVAFGKATKLLTYLVGLDKRYIGDVTFGTATATDDAEGQIIAEYNGEIDNAKCQESLLAIQGKINQIPPKYSAIHVDGQRAYKLANANTDFDIKPREVTIYGLDIVSVKEKTYTIDVHCSSGTYIRSIARDAGMSSGYYAHISSLRRMSVGQFSIESANTLDQIKSGEFSVLSPLAAVSNIGIQVIEILPEYADHFRSGKKLSAALFRQPMGDGSAFVRDGDTLLGMIENGKYKFVY
ncbi:MAG: tRNA pseudouridine(55) synthase TruB [Spirochaetales bacterium]|nr:tRNA pseudouridine(55) synthase TruB [Spirochaetales bacterium]